jgi:hypothetical protein
VRFVLAIIAFVLAAVLIGLGIAQRTIFAGPSEISASITVDSPAPVTVISGTTLNATRATQSVTASGSSRVFAAYAPTEDVIAWIGAASYNTITYNEKTQKLKAKLVEGTESTVPDPSGADIWLAQYDNPNSLQIPLNVPSDVSLLLVSDGTAPAPAQLDVVWPLDNRAPFAGPLILGGAVILLLGLFSLVWALLHLRRTRGPRRKPPKMPKLPRQRRYKPTRQSAITSSGKGRRAIGRGMIAVAVVLVSALVLSGCSAADWPSFGQAAPTPSATAKVDPAAKLQKPAVTEPQLKRIIADIAAVTKQADAKRDKTLAATRLDGPALQLRLANYATRAKDKKFPALPAIPAGPVSVTLPQQNDGWPRTVFAVIYDESNKKVAPVALMLVQQSPRENYKIQYAVVIEPGLRTPGVAPANLGTARLPSDTKLLKLEPSAIANSYAEILEKDSAASNYALFKADGDTLRTQVGLEVKKKKKAALPKTATIKFAHSLGIGDTIVLATNDAGAIVAVTLNEIEVVKPVEKGAAVNAVGAIKSLSGKSMSTKGIKATYGDQLLFYVPKSSSTDPIVLLGFSQGLIAATEL